MANRLRKNDIHVMITNDEKELFNRKLKINKQKSSEKILKSKSNGKEGKQYKLNL